MTVVDLRELYGMKGLEDTSRSQVLIVEQAGATFGLLLDSVEDIVSFQDEVSKILEIAGVILDLEKVLCRIERSFSVAS